MLSGWRHIQPPSIRFRQQCRDAGYGVKPRHYAPVGSALLWTLEQGLGTAFTPEVKDAWATAYIVLSTTMIDAANERPMAA